MSIAELALVAGGGLVVVAAIFAVLALGWGLYRATRSRDSSEQDRS